MNVNMTRKQRKDEIAKEGFRIGHKWGLDALELLGPIEQHYERPDEAAAFMSGFDGGCFAREVDYRYMEAQVKHINARGLDEPASTSTLKSKGKRTKCP